jgi:hypothetical protein
VGRHSVRQSMVVLQAMYEQAIRWGWVQVNPVKASGSPRPDASARWCALRPPRSRRSERALIAKGKLFAATMVSLVAYQGLRTPEELLALEVMHVRKNTLLVEQRNIVGKIVGGQKVRGFHPRGIDLLDPSGATFRSTCSARASAAGCCFPAATASRGGCTPTTTGASASGRGRGRRPASTRYRRTTCATRSPACRSEPACRFRRSRSRWGTRRR